MKVQRSLRREGVGRSWSTDPRSLDLASGQGAPGTYLMGPTRVVPEAIPTLSPP
jgi:hypothetical protein